MQPEKHIPYTGAARVAIVVSRYNVSITRRLLEGARHEYTRRSGDPASLAVIDAPGSFELPAICLAAAGTGRYAGILALGCIIRGETSHDQHIATAVAQGLISVTVATGIPVSFGVLTVETPEQAEARAGGARGNKGAEAMGALLDAIAAIERIEDGAMEVAGAPDHPRPDKGA